MTLGPLCHRIVRTLTIDKLASHGVRFASAYTAIPLCCPARAAMATGRFPHETGYSDNALAYDGRIPSWMHRLRGQGHIVAGIGKLHYRSSEQDNGFTEEFLGMHLLGARALSETCCEVTTMNCQQTMICVGTSTRNALVRARHTTRNSTGRSRSGQLNGCVSTHDRLRNRGF